MALSCIHRAHVENKLSHICSLVTYIYKYIYNNSVIDKYCNDWFSQLNDEYCVYVKVSFVHAIVVYPLLVLFPFPCIVVTRWLG